MASTPNAADLNAALPQFMSSSTTAFNAFDDLDINQTNFSELDEEEQDIAHIILSDPSLLGLDLLIGAGPPRNRTTSNMNATPTHDTGQQAAQRHDVNAPLPIGTMPYIDTIPSTKLPGSTHASDTKPQQQHQASNTNGRVATEDRPIRNLGFPRVTPGRGTDAQSANGLNPRSTSNPLSRSNADNSGSRSAGTNGMPGVMRAGEGVRADSPPKPLVKPPTMRKACDACHQAKQKCSGERPICERCRTGGWPCHYAVRQRRRAPGSSNQSTVSSVPPNAQQAFLARTAAMSQRMVPPQRRVPPLQTTGPSIMVPGHRQVMPNITHQITTRPTLPSHTTNTQNSSQVVAPIQIQANSGTTHVQEKAAPSPATTEPRIRSIAGPIKAGMVNFGQFSANAFLAKKFPGLMPGAGTPIHSPGQLPYMSKAFPGGAPSQNGQTSPPNTYGRFSPKPGSKRVSKKRKAKNGSGIASAEAENDLNVMDGFGYLYGFQDATSTAPGPSTHPTTHPYRGPVGWISTFGSDNRVNTTPSVNGHADQSFQRDGSAPEQLISPAEYLQFIHEDGLLADLDLHSHLAILAPLPKDNRLHMISSPSRTQASDDVLQDIAAILDPQFTNYSRQSLAVKTEDVEQPVIGTHENATATSNGEETLQMLQEEYARSEAMKSGVQSHLPIASDATVETQSNADNSVIDMDTTIFGHDDHAAATNLAAFNDEIFNSPYPVGDPHDSAGSSFMMEDLTDFAAWSAQAERDLAASEASSQFGTNPTQSPINAFHNPFSSELAVDDTDLDELLQLNAQNEEEQFALDLAAMFNEPHESQKTYSHSATRPSVTEDVQMDGGFLNIEELELALQQHAEMASTPVATASVDAYMSRDSHAKIEGPDTPHSKPWKQLPTPKDASRDTLTPKGTTPSSPTKTPLTPQNASTYPSCQHEIDISETLWALSQLQPATSTLTQLMPQLTRALEILVSLPACVVCSANPAQTIPQLALLSRTCITLLRPHPLTPSPLPLMIAGGRTTFTGLSPEIEVHIIDILWANWRTNALQKVFSDLERRAEEEGEKCKVKRQEKKGAMGSSAGSQEVQDTATPEELRRDVMTLALARFRAQVR
ncbi:hypothetical protein QFC21_001944 [Naganishia friedmannii]|uniref:Uncharacterized protein n=1 Tax=Naganishia friedmannii TaxID=89922 RepID=A0ACC2VZH7_9TREE|nr:hypothetical protein QFC21_001944 [Naganishia friedmannii]